MKGKTNEISEYERMTTSPVPRLIATLALPTVASMMVTSLYNMADTYFVSCLGDSAVSAVGVVFSIQSLIQAIGFGIGMGSSSLISRRLGAQDGESANRYASSAYFMALVLGLFLAVGGIAGVGAVMRLFGATETNLPYACEYGRIILIGAPVMCSSFVLNNILRAEGMPKASMVGLVCGGLINIVLDPLFIFVFDMGVSGAAAATVISQCVSSAVLLTFFLSGRSEVRISPRRLSRNVRDYLLILKTGIPTIARQGLGSLATTLLNITVRPYGDAAMAAISIANKIYMLLRNIVIGIGQGFQPVAGYNYGAKKLHRVRRAFVSASVFGSVLVSLAAIFTLFFSRGIMSAFSADSPEVIEIGSATLRFLCASLPFLAYSTYVNQLYQCLGYVAGATFLASLRQGVFFIPILLILPSVIGITGIEMAQALSDILTFIVSVPFQIWFFRKKLTPITGETEK